MPTAAVAPEDELPKDAPVLRELAIQRAQLDAFTAELRKLRASVVADPALGPDAAAPAEDVAAAVAAVMDGVDGGLGLRPPTRERLPPLVGGGSRVSTGTPNIWAGEGHK